MRIWFVDFEDGMEEAECAWTHKKDAVSYFKRIASESKWEVKIYNGTEEDDAEESFVTYLCKSDYCFFYVTILPIFLDEEPFF